MSDQDKLSGLDIDALLEQKLKDPDGAARLAYYGAQYLSDHAVSGELYDDEGKPTGKCKIGRAMLERCAKILRAFGKPPSPALEEKT